MTGAAGNAASASRPRAQPARLLLAIALLALASPLVKWLIDHGGAIGLAPRHAISFCNVLFVGNLAAGVTTFVIFGPRRIVRELRATGIRARVLIGVNVAFAVAIPAMFFTALETTTVTNLILLGRLESVVFALAAWILLRTAVSRGQLTGYAIIVAGVLVLVFVQGMGRLASGDLLVIAAATLQGVAAVTSRMLTTDLSVPSFVFLRNACSAVVFFVIAVAYYGFGHFADAFGPGLWLIMLTYAGLVVVVGQLAWYRSLAELPPATISSWSMLSPAIAITFAFLLLSETPTGAQIAGGAVIAAGMIAGRLVSRKTRPGAAAPAPAPAESALAAT